MNNDASVIAKTNITPALCVAAADDRDAIDDRTVDNEQAATVRLVDASPHAALM